MNFARMEVKLSIAVARDGVSQQAVLANWLHAHPFGVRAVISEGLFAPFALSEEISLRRLAPGCVCCTGFVPLRVNFMRLLREEQPEMVLLMLASGEHRDKVEHMLNRNFEGLQVQWIETDPSMRHHE